MSTALVLVIMIVLAIVLAITSYNVMRMKTVQQESQRVYEARMEAKLKASTRYIDLMDLVEFQQLDPLVKQYYKKYIARKMLPMIIGTLNKMLAQSSEYQYIKGNPEKVEKALDAYFDVMQKDLDNGSVEFLASVSAAQQPPSNGQSTPASQAPNVQQLNDTYPLR